MQGDLSEIKIYECTIHKQITIYIILIFLFQYFEKILTKIFSHLF